MNKHNEWKALLKNANEELKPKGYEIQFKCTDGCYDCIIKKNGRKTETFAENYYEEELQELVNDAWHHVKEMQGNAKLYIITINNVFEFTGYHHEPIVHTDIKEARKMLNSLKASAKETYKDEFDSCDNEKDSFSMYPQGYWGTSHYDARINTVEIQAPLNLEKIFTDGELKDLSMIFNEYKYVYRGNKPCIRRAMKLEAKLARFTDGRYQADTTYNT